MKHATDHGTNDQWDSSLPHGVRRADDPNEEAKEIGKPSKAAHRPGAIGVAPSVSDDSAGTSIGNESRPCRKCGTTIFLNERGRPCFANCLRCGEPQTSSHHQGAFA